MKTFLKINIKVVWVIAFFVVGVQFASADTSFTFNVPEGQGGGTNEFYHGRCVRVDVLLDTDSNDTGGADLEINYDNSRIAIVNDDCATAATTIYPDTQYQNYPNNHITATKITLGAYNNPGVPYNGSGRFAYFYFTVLDGSGDYNLDFEFTLGSTTDTNLAEYGSGNDILDHADDYIVHFADDNDVPYIDNENPADGTSGIQVISDILYRLNDDSAGVDFSTLSQSLTGFNWGMTSYTAGSSEISHTCQTTNANRIPHCDTTLNPTDNLYYCENYTVNTDISDLGDPTVHTLSGYSYSFDTESDDDEPMLVNLIPDRNAGEVNKSVSVDFDIRDIAVPGEYPGTGIDISTLSVNILAPGWGSQTYTTADLELTTTPSGINDYGNVYVYNISIDPPNDFPENTTVTVTVDIDDYGCPTVNHHSEQYTFTTADTIGPNCTLFTPIPNVVSMGTSDDITFHCTDSGVGVDIDTIRAIVDGTIYTASGDNQFTYAGDPSDYFITVNPVADFVLDYALEVVVNARDFSGNEADQESFGLATGVDGSCKICQVCEVCEDCEKCKDEKECDDDIQTVTKYETCSAIEKIVKNDSGVIDMLKAGSSIANTQLNNITLVKINAIEVTSDATVLVTVNDDVVIFEGDATPNTKVTLMIESDPIIVTGLSDDDGDWRIEMANIFPNGVHKVSAVTVSRDDYIIKSKFLSNFNVQRGRLGSCSWFCWLIIIILIILCYVLWRKYKQVKKELKNINKVKKRD